MHPPISGPATDPSEFDVIVIGGGPTGLAAALLSARAGRRTALIAPPAPPDARTSALLGGSIAFLDRLALWSDLRPNTAPLRQIRIVDGTHRLLRSPEVAFSASELGLEAFGYNLANTDLTKALGTALASAGVQEIPAPAQALELGERVAEVRVASGESHRARLIIAADGRNSMARHAAAIDTKSWRYDQAALVTNLAHELMHGDVSTEFHTETGPFTLVPLPGRRSSMVWVLRPHEAEALARLGEDELALKVEARAGSMLGKMSIDGPRQVFPLGGMSAQLMARSRVALVGEAAHVVPPIGAQGLNLGFRDVADLDPLFAEPDPGAPEALVAYERRRRVDISMRVQLIDIMNRSLLSPFLPVQAARGLGMFLLDRLAPLRRAAMRQGMALPASLEIQDPSLTSLGSWSHS